MTGTTIGGDAISIQSKGAKLSAKAIVTNTNARAAMIGGTIDACREVFECWRYCASTLRSSNNVIVLTNRVEQQSQGLLLHDTLSKQHGMHRRQHRRCQETSRPSREAPSRTVASSVRDPVATSDAPRCVENASRGIFLLFFRSNNSEQINHTEAER